MSKRLTFRGMLVLSPVYEIILSWVISRFGGGTCCTIVCGERFDFPRLSQDSVGEIPWGMIILIGEILGAYALTASLDRFPRFACGLDRPKPSLSL